MCVPCLRPVSAGVFYHYFVCTKQHGAKKIYLRFLVSRNDDD